MTLSSGAAHSLGRLLARPTKVSVAAASGLQPLELETGRDGVIYVPGDYRHDVPAPLVLMLHGAGGNGRGALGPLLPLADRRGLILVAPDARFQTWDILHGGYGPDVEFIDQALEQTFTRYSVDASRLAAEGFSDGASYALSIGLMNGDLFTHVIAFSPGFMAPAALEGRPRIYVSHGLHDRTLPIEVCSRRLVPRLERSRYDVVYHEFDGPHTVPEAIARDAADWFTPRTAVHPSP